MQVHKGAHDREAEPEAPVTRPRSMRLEAVEHAFQDVRRNAAASSSVWAFSSIFGGEVVMGQLLSGGRGREAAINDPRKIRAALRLGQDPAQRAGDPSDPGRLTGFTAN